MATLRHVMTRVHNTLRKVKDHYRTTYTPTDHIDIYASLDEEEIKTVLIHKKY